MGHWTELRRQAREQHQALLAAAGQDPSAAALLAAAARLTGIDPEPLPPGDPLLQGALAVLDREAESIFYDQEVDPSVVPLYVAHEYAHLWRQHGGCNRCTAADLDAEAAEEAIPLGVHRVEGYGPEERREREANVFARELLLPSDVLRRWYMEDGLSAAAIAGHVGVPDGIVFHQLTRALLTPDLGLAEGEAGSVPELPALDASQRDAAHVPEGPTLVEAGPGTGKTRALVGRVIFLLEREVPPAGILCLTFSNKAAEEMRERVAKVAPEAALELTMGTFHAFGLEILRKYGSHLGLSPRPPILDPADALLLLERFLPRLGFQHYQNLYEPTTYLRDVSGAISRAKDELCDPAEYRALAEQMRERAETPEQVEAAEKALEVAGAYALYQAHLEQEGVLDFGDLIFRTVLLLRQHPNVRHELRATYSHILVDEYQDVNRASGLLLKEIAGDGRGLWVVGDARQSIYRWRGASPANMRLFASDFPGAQTKVLQVNYRSRPVIVDVVAELAPRMRAAAWQPFTPWEPNRPADGGEVRMEVADDLAAEAAGIGREIERQRGLGIPYQDQAVLCRSHTQLARLALDLERAGIPVLYLGDLFERPEIRDQLSLLSLACHGDGHALLRVARFPEYNVPLADVRSLLAAAREREVPFPRALRMAPEVEGLSEHGRQGLARLSEHLDDLCYGTQAWTTLVRYLFERSSYLRNLLRDESVAGQQKRLAIYQFLQFAHQQRGHAPEADAKDPKRTFLRYVRRLEIFGEEKQLRQVPEWAAGIDAVRLLTVHASKGLEFGAVYLPGLAAGFFPASRQPEHCPPPEGMIAGAPGDPREEHEEEEECLFFVALSRAREVLCLSRPARYGKRNSNPSRLLPLIEPRLPRSPDSPVTWPCAAAPAEVEPVRPPEDLPEFDVSVLEIYLRCPRQYLYEVVLGLSGRREDSAYVLFHRCVYHVLHWVQAERTEGRELDVTAALSRLDEAWEAFGPWDHPYATMYRESAERLVQQLLVEVTGEGVPLDRPTWTVPLRYGRVRLTPDHVVAQGNGPPRVFRLRTGRASKKEMDKPIYGLYQAAFAQAHPGEPLALQVLYLTTGEQEAIAFKPGPLSTRLNKYEAALAGILQGHFPPDPDDRKCPRCPHYFICPMAEDT